MLNDRKVNENSLIYSHRTQRLIILSDVVVSQCLLLSSSPADLWPYTATHRNDRWCRNVHYSCDSAHNMFDNSKATINHPTRSGGNHERILIYFSDPAAHLLFAYEDHHEWEIISCAIQRRCVTKCTESLLFSQRARSNNAKMKGSEDDQRPSSRNAL